MSISRRHFLRTTGAVAAMGAATTHAKGLKKPNILWITSEDNNVSWIGCYGNKDAHTPNIDTMAKEGFRYTQCYSNGAVCSATRSSWITGMYSPAVGIHHHRSAVDIPNDVPLYPEFLKKAGYYVANHTKQDYNILRSNPRISALWDSSSDDWNKSGDKPFFQVINLGASHESKLFGAMPKDGKTFLGTIEQYEGFEHDPQKLEVKPYHPDIAGVRATYACYYDSITKMDSQLGEILERLEKDGLADDTIVIHNSDHGGAIPRGKRYMANSGTHCPLIVRIPEKYKHYWPAETPGTTVDRLVSFYDMPKTWLSIAGAEISPKMHGKVFLGPDQEPESKWHFSYRGRNDERNEFARAIRDKKYVYIRNFYPFVPKGQYLSYQWKILLQREWEAAFKAGMCDEVTGRFFTPRGMHELYDTEKDPHCINNLADHPEQAERVEAMRKELYDYARKIRDVGFLPESEMLKRAHENNVTVYKLAQNPNLCNIDAYIEMADLASEGRTANLPALMEGLESSDSGVRYWASLGCMYLGKDAANVKPLMEKALDDESHEVRNMAAWYMIKLGEQDKGVACIKQNASEIQKIIATLPKKDQTTHWSSKAKGKIQNVVDWLGEDGKTIAEYGIRKSPYAPNVSKSKKKKS